MRNLEDGLIKLGDSSCLPDASTNDRSRIEAADAALCRTLQASLSASNWISMLQKPNLIL